MDGYESFYREDPLEVRSTSLPAEHYNLAHRLLVGSGGSCLFVPIRSIQYLAVIDADEIIFVDREAKHLIELAWCHFRPQARAGLGEPVPYELHLYLEKARQILPRLQDEFFKALNQLDSRAARDKTELGSVLPFPSRNK